jgi:hypothetical protein
MHGSGSGSGTGTSSSASTSAIRSSSVSTFSGTCSVLDACCQDLDDGAEIAECESIAADGAGSACESELDELAAEGFCTGTPVPFLDAGAPPPGFDSGVIGASCAIGGDCEPPGSFCTNPGAGPCSSDEQLQCGPAGLWVANGFPCSSSIPSCGFSDGTCSETCDCDDGLIVCTGDCPDGGPSMP